MTRICVLAMNSVVRDIRIIKEADTLADAGHDVTVIGLLDNHAPGPETLRESGVRILRRDHRRYIRATRAVENVLKRSAMLGALATLVVYATAIILFSIPSNTTYTQLLVYFGISGMLLGAVWFSKWFSKWFSEWFKRLGIKILISGVLAVAAGATIISIPAVYARLLERPLISALIVGSSVFAGTSFWFLRIEFIYVMRMLKRRFQHMGGAQPETEEGITTQYAVFDFTNLRNRFYRAVTQTAIRRELVKGAVAARPDVIHCQDLGTLPSGVRAKRHTGARLVFDAHEIYEEVAQGNERLKRRYKKMLRRHEGEVDDFITINDSIADFYAKNYPKLPKAVIIKNATLKAKPFTYDGRMHEAAQLPGEQKILLYQGGFATKRGLTTLVEAARWLQPDWTLVMMGWGTLEKALRKSADEVLNATQTTRKTPAIVFIPPASHEELAQWTAGGTIGVIPYDNIGLNHLYCSPNKLWEYPNAGVPILCSPLVEMTKTIKENKIGWLFPEDLTPKNLAETVNAISDKEIAMARKACRLYLERDNWSIYAKRLVDLYDRIPKKVPAKVS